jgi:hypothetical protein
MPTLPATVPDVAPPPEVVAMTTEQLRAALSRSMARTAAELTRLAWIVRVLEERGEDLSDLRVGLLDYLRFIAYGRLVPEAVVRFGSDPALLRAVQALPNPDQRRLAEGGPVTVVVRRGDAFDRREVDPTYLTAGLRRQVFGRAGLRSEAEQIAWLEDRDGGHAPAKPARSGPCVADPRRGGIRVGRTFVPAADVVAALASLKGPTEGGDDDPLEVTVITRLTRRQHTSLKIAADRGQTDMQVLIRHALAAQGLLHQE